MVFFWVVNIQFPYNKSTIVKNKKYHTVGAIPNSNKKNNRNRPNW